MKAPSNGFSASSGEGERKINSELWHACAGPLVSIPPVGSLVVYFPQGHSEQVAATMQKETDSIPNYPSLPSKLICVLHNVTLHADAETDEVYAQMTLQPVTKCDREALLASDLGLKQNKHPAEFFCKTLTASDTSTHGGFSVPRRSAEKIFPPLDFSMQPPAQELVAKDLHDVAWAFRHIFRGQPKRHLLTTGWSVFVSTKRLLAGDSVLFIRDEKSQLLLGIRRANRQQPALSSSVLSSDSMHIGILAAAAHAAANNSPFTIFFNPRASPSEFVVPLAKYHKAMYTQVSLGMRFRMMFETEESGVRRYMGTITGISDLDPVRWKNSQWRNLQVGWDESTAGERRNRVSIWEIEPVATPFYIYPPPFFRPKLPKQPGMPDDESEVENAFKRAMPWLGDDIGLKEVQSPVFPGLSLVQWMGMQQNPQLIASAAQSAYFPSRIASTLQNSLSTDDPSKILSFQANALPLPNLQFNIPKPLKQTSQLDGFQQTPLMWSQQQLQQQGLAPPQLQPPHQQQQPPQHQLQQTPACEQQQPQPTPLLLQHQQQQLQQMTPINLQQQQPTPVHLQQQKPQQQTPICPQQQTPQLQLQQQTAIHPQQQQQLLLQQQHQAQQLQQHQAQQLQQQQLELRPAIINQGVLDQPQRQHLPFPIQTPPHPQHFVNQLLQSPQTKFQQQGFLSSNAQLQQSLHPPNQNSFLSASQPQSLNLQQQMEQPHVPSPKQQVQQVQLNQPHLQMQLLQKLQQQQVLSQLSPHLQSPLTQQLTSQQNQPFHQQQLQQEQVASTLVPPAPLKHLSADQIPSQFKPQLSVRDHSTPASCSTSPSSNSCCISPSNLLNRAQQGLMVLPAETTIQLTCNLGQEHQSRSDIRPKQESHCTKETDSLANRHAMTDQMDASSSATSFCLDGSAQESFSLPPICSDNEVQEDPRNNLLLGANIDGLPPDTLLSRAFGSGRDLQNLLSSYGNQGDIETELSTAAINSQSFGVLDMPFKPGSSSDTAMNENGVLNRGLWANQQQRMRTYTKVQKRGSVGRSIDITRYKGYDELRRDLARMFGIEGQLEDTHRTDWKLVYVDHENDILLVGDDPWEEFVSCVQSIKIFSAAEVQQMSLDGDLGNMPVQNQACSGSNNGNMWKGYHDDNSNSSFGH